jgi:Protein of unknown function (DUF4236)/Bacterial SH3 domain
MGYFRFRRSIKILPGVRWNIGKKSTSVSLGGRGLTYTIGTKGSRTTVGIPGTGISYTQVHSSKPSPTSPSPAPLPPTPASPHNPAKPKLSRVFYALGFIALIIWSLGKLPKQNAPYLGTTSSPRVPLYSPVPTYAPKAIPRALPVETSPIAGPPPTANESPAWNQTQNSPSYPGATLQSSATLIPRAVAPTYRIVNIAPRDFLNVRQGPGSSYPVVARIPSNARGIKPVPRRIANGSTIWQEISVGGYTGWVNEIYLKAERAAP